MADKFDTVNTLSILLGGRRPEWIRQIDAAYPNGLPDAGSGVALRDSPRTQLLVDMREEIRHRICRVAIRVLDLTSTYRIFIDGNAVDFDAAGAGSTSALEVLEGWRDAINADVTVNPIVTASVEDADGDGTDDTLVITGDTEADYTIGVIITVGSAELDVLADPNGCSLRVFLTDKPPKAQGVAVPNAAATGFVGTLGAGDWRQPNGATYSVGSLGFCDFFDTAGYDRIYAELSSITAPADTVAAPHTYTLTPRITVGPSILE